MLPLYETWRGIPGHPLCETLMYMYICILAGVCSVQVAGGSHGQEVSYAYFKGFNQFLGNLDILRRVVNAAAKTGPATQSTGLIIHTHTHTHTHKM